MLKLRSIGIHDYSVLADGQRIGRIRLADERMPSVWLWNVTIHLPGGLPMGSSMPACERVKTTARSPPKRYSGILKAQGPAPRKGP